MSDLMTQQIASTATDARCMLTSRRYRCRSWSPTVAHSANLTHSLYTETPVRPAAVMTQKWPHISAGYTVAQVPVSVGRIGCEAASKRRPSRRRRAPHIHCSSLARITLQVFTRSERVDGLMSGAPPMSCTERMETRRVEALHG